LFFFKKGGKEMVRVFFLLLSIGSAVFAALSFQSGEIAATLVGGIAFLACAKLAV
jgi:hypothetical protein